MQPIRFLHCADIHLGYQQYNSTARMADFARALMAVVQAAIDAQVDFVVLAGDLFQKRAIDALTLNQAMVALERLRDAAIPCIAVEGNHERAYYDSHIGWMEFLAQRRLLHLLNAEFVDGKPLLKAWDDRPRAGSFVDPVPGVRVHGLRWTGSGTAAAIEAYAAALVEEPANVDRFTIFVAHAGVEGVIDGMSGGLSHREWSVLRPVADYVALGHIHKPFVHDDWLYNPGSPETCATVEADWPERGYFLVEIDPDPPTPAGDEPAVRHHATLHANPRRRFEKLHFKVDHYREPDALHSACEEFLERKNRELKLDALPDGARPVVELQLSGVLPFGRSALDIQRLETALATTCRPLVPLLKNLTRATEFEISTDDRVGHAQLEQEVIMGLLDRDTRYQGQSEQWAEIRADAETAGRGRSRCRDCHCGAGRAARSHGQSRHERTPSNPCSSSPSAWKTSRATPSPSSSSPRRQCHRRRQRRGQEHHPRSHRFHTLRLAAVQPARFRA